MKILHIDTETTGINEEQHSIIQLAGLIEIDDKIVEKFNIKMRPWEGARITKHALKVNNTSIEDLKTYQSFKDGYTQFKRIIYKYIDPLDKKDKMFVEGYNIAFDIKFIRKMFEKNDDIYYGSLFWSHSIDTMSLATVCLMETRHLMENFKLGTVCRQLGIGWDDEKAHDAMYDIIQTVKLYRKIIKGE